MVVTTYQALCFLRIVLVFLPEIGYIHPDEHFQGSEIVYGDIFGFEVHRTWEFASVNPIRNIVLPYVIVGIPSFAASLMGIMQYHGTTTFPYLMLVIPRVIMCFFSFLHDYFLFKICIMMRKNYRSCLKLFASSYIILVYFTRTFSNSLEGLFLTLLFFLVCKLMHMQKGESNHVPNLLIVRCSYLNFMLGIIIAIGCFNRPTFICFAAFPTMVLLYHISKKEGFMCKLYFLTAFFLGVTSLSVSYIAIDSLYYNKAHYSFITPFSNIWRNTVNTPLSFILYNTNSKNLNAHGLHPRWLHLVVNVPLLFFVPGLHVIINSIRSLHMLFQRYQLCFTMFFEFSFIIPLCLLSFIPHQEPRFIIPLIIPLALLYADSSYNIFFERKYLLKVWCIFNIVCLIFYGFLHQGGIYLSMSYIHSEVKSNNYSVIFYKTYMPPRYLLALNKNEKDVRVHDFSGIETQKFLLSMHEILAASRPKNVFVVLPYKILNSFFCPNIFSNYKFLGIQHKFPHISTENPPILNNIWTTLNNNVTLMHKISDLKKMLSIQILIFQSTGD